MLIPNIYGFDLDNKYDLKIASKILSKPLSYYEKIRVGVCKNIDIKIKKFSKNISLEYMSNKINYDAIGCHSFNNFRL